MGDEASYQAELEREVAQAIEFAETARTRGSDPHPTVEIPVAQDMADRVENLLGVEGIAARIRELEGEVSREHAALHLAEDIATGSLGEFDEPGDRVETAVRTAVALLTEGVVAAPIEGIDRVAIEDAADGTSFVRITYAGPIRSAGGTAQALSVLVADYTRRLLDIDAYRPSQIEIGRVVEEVELYERETGLQYTPSREEITHIAEHCPIMLDGEPTTEDELDSYRDLDRIDTNRGRGGMCLVLAEGIAQKADKLARYVDSLDAVDWPWLTTLRTGKGETEEVDTSTASGPVGPKDSYLVDLIAGRPVVAHPSRPGGFRLRYGRARNHGLATAGVHPATMHLLDDFLAPGTQLKTERPGKAAGVVPVDTIEGPTVMLHDGSVRRLEDPVEAKELRNGVAEILDIGEYLVNVGEFVENNHRLVPGAYDTQRWRLEMAEAGADVQALADDPEVSLTTPGPERAVGWAQRYDAPIHPHYTYLYHDATIDELGSLAAAIETGHRSEDGLLLSDTTEIASILCTLLVPHESTEEGLLIEDWLPLARTLGFSGALERDWETLSGEDPLEAVNEIAPFPVRAKAPTRVGARMGRPEKSEPRELSPAVHCLFPVGAAGGDQRSIAEAAAYRPDANGDIGEIEVELNRRRCTACGQEGVDPRCQACGERTEPVYICPDCAIEVEADDAGRHHCPRCGREGSCVQTQAIDIGSRFDGAFEDVDVQKRHVPMVKGVKGLTSETKAPEPLEKGVLRADHDITVFKDGTSRYDMTDLPVTAVRPAEVGVDAETFRELGYETDIEGDELRYDDQVVELHYQDVILSDDAAEYLYRTSQFVDDLLTDYYDLEPFYELEGPEDLVGELVLGLAPHTSAAVTGRVVGFTSAAVGYAHPFFHAAKRRNCFHPETKMWYKSEDGQWQYESIERFVETRIDDPTTDDFGTLVQDLDESPVVPSIDDSGTLVWKPVTTVSKHPAPDHLIHIETRSGREIKVTPDHDVQVFDGNSITSKRASDLTNEDYAVLPDHIDLSDSIDNTKEFDLLDEFLDVSSIDLDCLMIRGLEKENLYTLFDEVLEDDWDGEYFSLKSTAEYLDISQKTLSNYIYRDSFPAGVLRTMFESRGEFLDFIPRNVRLGMKHDSVEINRIIRLNEGVSALLGFYAAEGFTREQKTPKGTVHQTTFTGTEREIRAYYMDVLRQEFGVKPYYENNAKVTVSGRLFRTLFDTVLDAGKYANTKRAPQPIFDSPDSIVAAYLNGYFCGDGSVSRNNLSIEATTISSELKKDLLALLNRLGIFANVCKNDRVPLHKKFPEFYEPGDSKMSEPSYTLSINSKNAVRFANKVGFLLSRKDTRLNSVVDEVTPAKQRVVDGGNGDYLIDSIESIEVTESTTESTYNLTVKDSHSLIVNNISEKQCDGDEDCVMLMMDGLLNFSRSYLPSNRGGRMDAPLVLSTRIDPAEIDDEAHNIETVSEYPLGLYEAADEYADSDEVDIALAGDSVGPDTLPRFGHTDDPSDFSMGPDLSAYKTLESMEEKLTAQLELARKLRAVDESDVAERVIEGHYLPDLLGNLRAFSSQETRCRDCGKKYRRVPLTGSCHECSGTVSLTVYEGMVNKYLEPAIDIAEQYDVRPYTRQRLDILETTLESLFEDDTDKQAGIADFM